MTIYEYVLAQLDARERAAEWIRGRETWPDHCGVPGLKWQPPRISIAGDLGGVYKRRDARRKWVRAA